jgi:hypothetical protein
MEVVSQYLPGETKEPQKTSVSRPMSEPSTSATSSCSVLHISLCASCYFYLLLMHLDAPAALSFPLKNSCI